MPKTNKQKLKKSPLYRRKAFLWSVGMFVGLIIVVLLAFRLSPWPGALVIRAVFNRGGYQTLRAMQAKLPDYPVTVLANRQYRDHDEDAKLDAYIPSAAIHNHQTLPVIVWTHGGAWLSGDKSDDGPYFKRLANEGFVVIALDYSLAPGKTYPTTVHQLNDAYAYIQTHASDFHANTNKFILAGDSAGAQLSSQMAAILTSPAYAEEVGIQPSLPASHLIGVMLFCGIYKMEGLTQPDPTLPGLVSWGNDITVWAYSGTRDKSDPLIRQMSPYYHVTKAFPATFISGGNGDPLTNEQSIPFGLKLKSLGVNISTLFFAQDHTPSLPHEYQFTFNNEGEQAFTATTQFLKQRIQ